MYKVSVVIPIYNAGKYIERCLRSLFEQTLDEVEYIFVDDCSLDNSMDILYQIMEEYPKRKKDVKIITHEVNTGQSGARRDGMRIATGEYVIHCDSDDWVDLEMYELMYRKAIEDQVEAVCCDIAMEFDDRIQMLRVLDGYEDHQLMSECIVPISVEYFSMCNRLVSRKVYERHTIQPFEGVNMWDDVGMSIRIRYFVKGTSVINRPLYHYNRQNEVSTTRRPLKERIDEQDLCIEHLTDFFKQESALEQYRLFLSYLKLHSIEELFFHDVDEWLSRFADVKHDLWTVRKLFRGSYLVKFYTLRFGGIIGKLIWRRRWKQ